VLAVFNFSGAPHEGWRLGVPKAGRWRAILSSDAPRYGGAGRYGADARDSAATPSHGQSNSIIINMQALSATWYIWDA
jgi:1,4-alpha-glucan branching enzyme